MSLSLSLFVCDVVDGTRDVEKLTGLFSRRMSSDGNPDFLPRKLSSLHLQHLLRNSKRICRTQLKSDSNSDGNPDFLPRKLSSFHLHHRPSSSESSPSFLMSDVFEVKDFGRYAMHYASLYGKLQLNIDALQFCK